MRTLHLPLAVDDRWGAAGLQPGGEGPVLPVRKAEGPRRRPRRLRAALELARGQPAVQGARHRVAALHRPVGALRENARTQDSGGADQGRIEGQGIAGLALQPRITAAAYAQHGAGEARQGCFHHRPAAVSQEAVFTEWRPHPLVHRGLALVPGQGRHRLGAAVEAVDEGLRRRMEELEDLGHGGEGIEGGTRVDASIREEQHAADHRHEQRNQRTEELVAEPVPPREAAGRVGVEHGSHVGDLANLPLDALPVGRGAFAEQVQVVRARHARNPRHVIRGDDAENAARE